jgi:hypothetical protein
MPRRQLPLLFAACAILGAAAGARAQVLDDKANMKILSARSLMLRVNHDYFNDQLRKSGAPTTPEETLDMYRARVGCGSVDIGNQFVDKGIGNEISVIIVGDVINVGNRCAR